MIAMQIFERCRAAEGDKRAMRERIKRYMESATRITAALDGVGERSTDEQDKLAAIMGEVDELEQAIKAREKRYAVEVAAACKLLDMLPEQECRIINGYYLDGTALTVLAKKLSYSYGYVRTIKSQACAHLDSIPEAMVAQLLPAWYLENER